MRIPSSSYSSSSSSSSRVSSLSRYYTSLSIPFLQILPFVTLILALPAPVSTSASVSPSEIPGLGQDTHFTPSTFSSSIAQGLWFVEHFSPWCGHCQHFRPTWEKLVEEAGRGVWEDDGGEGIWGEEKGKGKDGDEKGDGDKKGKGKGEDLKEVRMGSVDCSVHGDLCDANNIKGYPTLLMFNNGKIVETFKGPREMEDLKVFMSKHVRAVRAVKEEEEARENARVKAEEEKELEKKEREREKEAKFVKQVNNAAGSSNTNTNINPNGEVLALDHQTFDAFFSSSSSSSSSSSGNTSPSPPTFIKFFAPWCGHCRKLAPVWKLLGKHMQGRVAVAEVDCDAKGNKKLCEREGVEGYPTLVWYPRGVVGGGEKTKGMVYEQGRKLEQLKAFAEKASSAGVQTISDVQELDKYVAEEDVVYLLLHSEGDDQILNQIRTAASPLLGSPLILSSSSPSLFARYSLIPSPSSASTQAQKPWALLALKDHDHIFPSAIYHGSSFKGNDNDNNKDNEEKGTVEGAREWLLTHRVPTASELTRDTFQSVMNAPQKPIVVLALSSSSSSSDDAESEKQQQTEDTEKEKVLSRLRDLAGKWRMRNRKRVFGVSAKGNGDEDVFAGREVVFAWMDDGKWKDWVKSMYGVVSGGTGAGGGLEDVRVVLADHANLVYYDTDSGGNAIRFTSSASIFAAVEDALNGRTAYKHSEGVVERLARYLNTKLQSLEHSVTSHPFRSVLVLIGVLGGVFWVLARFVGGGADAVNAHAYEGGGGMGANGNGNGGVYKREREVLREGKGRKGRLD